MAEAMRRRLASEEGISLVEIMVAFAVLALVLLGFAATLTSSLHALVGNESRTTANALANDVLEDAQQVPWEDLTTGTETWTEGPYTVTRETAWADDDSVAGTDDYLEFTVTIDWEDLGVSRAVTHEARRSPPARKVLDDQRATLRSIRIDPEIGYLKPSGADHAKVRKRVVFDEDGNAEGQDLPMGQGAAFTVRTTLPVNDVKVSFVDRSGTTTGGSKEFQSDAAGTEWTLAGTETNGWKYRNGDTTFTFSVVTDEGTFTGTKVVRYVFEYIEPIDGPNADPEVVCVDDDGEGDDPVEISVEFEGLTIDDEVEVIGGGLDAGESWFAEHTSTTGNGSVFVFELPEGHAYPSGATTTVEMVGTRAFDGKTNLDDDSADGGTPPAPAEVELTLLRPGDDGYDDECAP